MSKRTPPPSDQAARDRFIHETGINFCVAAGAGAGKTTAITRRIASIAANRAADPTLLSRQVVVTFTILAAEELRARTRRELLRQMCDPKFPLYAASKSAHGRQRLLADLRGAFFGTIHSFCLKLIREFGMAHDLPEDVDLLAPHEVDAEWERFTATERFEAVQVDSSLLRHLAFTQLVALARKFEPEQIDRALSADSPGDYPGLPDVNALRGFRTNARTKPKIDADIQTIEEWINECHAAATYAPLPLPTSSTKDFCALFQSLFQPLREWTENMALREAAGIAAAFRSHRLENRLLTYADQIYYARKLVGDPTVLRAMRQRRWMVILDEAQDTDRRMFEILSEIVRPPDADVGTWPDGDGPGPEPGRFSFVGDDQQSIYRDRADPADYRRYVDAFAHGRGGETLAFDVTMRCSDRVIAACNRVFVDALPAQTHLRFRALAPRPTCPLGGVWRLPLETTTAEMDSEMQLDHEIDQVGRWLKETGRAGLGVARWSDVAVIAPRKDWLGAAALRFRHRHNLPAREHSPKWVRLELPAITWPLALLHVLVEPWDRFELIGVLREIFAVSDVELARLHQQNGLRFFPDLPAAVATAPERLRQALQLLHALRIQLDREGVTLPEIFDLVVQKAALTARMQAVGHSTQMLDALRVQAMQAAADGMSLRDWLRLQIGELDQPPDEMPAESDAIQFLTCQKAKGLEWPVVILLGLGRKIGEGGKNEEYPRLSDRRGVPLRAIFAKLPDEDGSLKLARDRERDEEFQRFLYVSMTRAKSVLIIPETAGFYHAKKGIIPNFAALVSWSAYADSPTFPEISAAVPLLPRAEITPAQIPAPLEVISLPADRWIEAARISAQIPAALSPSRMTHDPLEPVVPDLSVGVPIDEEPTPLLLGIGGKDYGTWWHDTLERFPWHAIEARRAEFVARTVSGIPAAAEWRDRGHEELKRFAASEICRELTKTGKFFLSEIPFSHAVAGEPPTWIEGILDLLLLRQDGTAWIVDWKTDRRRESESAEELLARLREIYAPQVDAYAGAIEAAGRVVTRRTIYSTVLGSAIDC